MRTLLWCLIAVALVSLGFNMALYLQHKRQGKPIPTYATGNVTSSVGFLLLLVSQLVDLDSLPGRTALAASLAFLIVSIAFAFVAWRRARHIAR